MVTSNYKEEVFNFLGPIGAMVSNSKSGYREKYPSHIVVFNANVCILYEERRGIGGLLGIKKTSAEKIWWGDFDLTLNFEYLRNLSAEICRPVVLLQEMDARFEHEVDPKWENFVYRANPDGTYEIGKSVAKRVDASQDSVEWITY